MQPMSKVRSLLLACAVLGGCNNAAAPLPACSAALPSGAMPTVQLAIPEKAGQPYLRHFTYRGIGGVSMGGFGSSVNFWAHPDRYDAIGVMGADPGPDLTYSLGMIHDFFMAGFCTAPDDGVQK